MLILHERSGTRSVLEFCFVFLKQFVLGQLSKLKSSRDDSFGHTWLTARQVYDNDEQT